MTQLTNVAFLRAEPGCLNYDLHQSRDDTGVWFVYENWRSAEGFSVHMQSEHLRAFPKAAPDLIAGDMDLRQFAMISKNPSPCA